MPTNLGRLSGITASLLNHSTSTDATKSNLKSIPERINPFSPPIDKNAVRHFAAPVSPQPVREPPYNRDVHLQLTDALALAAGFNHDDAGKIARANQKVDDDKSTTPIPSLLGGAGVDRRRMWHFTTPERRAEVKR